ncbi:hypothetical protein F5X68DRAFT_175794 [Plectosphaerella plurivora]|uniref:AAA+ ATPase domain-containing protein n=1 Tax=Plectosphaerella plurivora TaxID=936078 RepID=A0A9P9A6J0_9PEZI|nr:hypothetical protein F5X68DRAFT_175794 [Plectosphaerella plurivora]
MGTLVANMPTNGLGETKKLHPFFTGKPSATAPQTPTPTESHVLQETNAQPSGPSNDREEDEAGRSTKRRKTSMNGEAATPSTLHPEAVTEARPASGSLVPEFFKPKQPAQTTINDMLPQPTPAQPVTGEQNGETPAAPEQEQLTPTATSTRPKRVLKLNMKTGTIGSPPKPKSETDAATKAGQKTTLIVSIRFGTDTKSRQRIGAKIEGILAAGPRAGVSPLPKKRGRPSKADKARKALLEAQTETSKSTQAPKATTATSDKTKIVSDKKKAEPSKPTGPKSTMFSSTPCSPKKARSTFKCANMPQFGSKNMGLKVPGAAHPAWPTKEATHVTGGEATTWASKCHASALPFRKSKGRPAVISSQESIVQRLGDTLRLALSQPPGTYTRAAEQRLPTKHFESGLKLQSRIRPELKTPLPAKRIVSNEDSDEDIITSTRDRSHPAISRLYNSLVTNLSAHDRSECEDVAWAQKYAPESAAEILQSGREALMLRDWLEALKVQAVDTGPAADAKSVAKPIPTGKKKKRKLKMDGFIVSSDDDAYEPDDLSDPEDMIPGQTVVQNGGNIPPPGKDAVKLSNISLLSGPHGSGKTATVYAIAKELGFEVFEINASTRRSGKDVTEKVGDMTRNHLVRHNDGSGKGVTGEGGKAKEPKKGSVMSFFKPKKTGPVETPKPAAPTSNGADPKPTSTPKPRSQKQSLILLEEVDLLYEEDKQFWATVTSLIVQSKRPFIMTCNDESTVPFQTLNLYGIFRFSPPPQDLAVDYLLLAAANEGHALRRPAVQALLESRTGDLRAAMTELNYWCQLGVGDRRGGFDWFYPRWPRGCDKDENGNTVRVISEGTYLEGMGWLGQDSAALDDVLSVEEELVSQCWDGFQMDVSDWHKTRDMSEWATALPAAGMSKLSSLAAFESFSDSMSAADVISQGRLGLGLEATPHIVEYQPLCRDMSLAIRSKTRALAQATSSPDCMKQIDLPETIRLIRRSFTNDPSGNPITRMDMAHAFDPIAISDHRLTATSFLDPSVFDRTMQLITIDVAPFVRGIVTYDRHVAEGHIQRGTLVSEGARPGKRLRQTRTSADAAGFRRESYFRARVNPYLVMRTGGQWEQAVTELIDATVVEVVPQPEMDMQYAPVPMPPAVDNTVGGRYMQIQPRPGVV